MKKIACYLMTRNIYKDVLPSLKSLLKNGNVDRVYLLIEDDDIGFDLPARVITVNISKWKGQLRPDGPNMGCRWSYMVMLKVIICKMFPKLHRILTIDVDTIVRGDLSPLWDIPIGDYYFAGAREPYWTKKLCRDYVNAGVLMWNMDKMRDGTADYVLAVLNYRHFGLVEQDALNEICAGKFRIFDAAYNAGDWTEPPKIEIRIRHYMASKGMWKVEPEVEMYGRMPWEEVLG
jgi:lipopolysaccharide biosynthesis glycosyltransferase